MLKAATLPVVIVISVLVLLIVLFVYSLWDLNTQYYFAYHYKKQQMENINSAVVLYGNDSTFLTDYNQGDVICLYESDTTSAVKLNSGQWGFYEYLHVSSHNDNFSSTRLLGKKDESSYRAALWLCDRNRALSLSGNTEVNGKIFTPLNGINYIETDGEKYKGKEIHNNQMNIAGALLPPIDSTTLVFPESVKEYRDMSEKLPEDTDTHYSFNEATRYFNISQDRAEIVLRGNAVLFAEDITISSSSKINEAIVVARKVTIEDGFKGSLQIFCSDSVLVEENVTLQYPSGIYLNAQINYPFVSLAGYSEINGYVIILGRLRDEELMFPSYKQLENSHLRGLLYVDGTSSLQGDISGAAYLKDCFFASNLRVYAGTLYNTRINRNNHIAYPIFMSGGYTRKEIKSI